MYLFKDKLSAHIKQGGKISWGAVGSGLSGFKPNNLMTALPKKQNNDDGNDNDQKPNIQKNNVNVGNNANQGSGAGAGLE